MAEPLKIDRRTSTHSETSFDSLRKEAIALLQQFSGKTWTDYNLHDPGVTILEQLIYAITDLVYRSEFALEDYLVDDEGKLDLETCSLHTPVEIFPCRPTTASDYRKLLLNAVPEADNLWLTPVVLQPGKEAYGGLYQLSVKLAQGLAQPSRDAVIDRLRRAYHASRNLCEDLTEDIVIVENLEFELCASIEVSSAYYPADILAEVYFQCARRMAGDISITLYDQIDRQAESLERLFDGPYTVNGFFIDADRQGHQSDILLSTLFATINSIEGVDHIQELYLSRDDERYYDRTPTAAPNQAFDLSIPRRGGEIKVQLLINGRVIPVDLNEVVVRIEEFRFKDHTSRSTPQDLALLYRPITGVSRPLDQYYSLQNHFPVGYGINQFGVPENAATDIKAKARQLKAYLVIFEQLIANFLANVGSVKTLFSVQTEPPFSYATQSLADAQIHDLDAIYPAQAHKTVSEISAAFDNYDTRKNRVLDYLLAIYGERFTQNALKHFNYYYSKDELNAAIIDNKIAYLNSIVELSRDRAAAPDYDSGTIPDNRVGLALRLTMLLGFQQHQTRATTAVLREQEIMLSTHDNYQREYTQSDEYDLVDAAAVESADGGKFEPPVLLPMQGDLDPGRLREKLGNFLTLQTGLISDKLLGVGINIERYRLGSLTDPSEIQLLLQIDHDHYWKLGGFTSKSAANQAANDLRHYLLFLNQCSEGLHIVEHILLRPQRQTEVSAANAAPEEDFFSFRISAIFSGWTARCADKQFRKLAEETLRLNTPAHVHPDIYWLEFEQMVDFEDLYRNWWSLKCQSESEPADLERSARRVIEFLRQLQVFRERGPDTEQ